MHKFRQKFCWDNNWWQRWSSVATNAPLRGVYDPPWSNNCCIKYNNAHLYTCIFFRLVYLTACTTITLGCIDCSDNNSDGTADLCLKCTNNYGVRKNGTGCTGSEYIYTRLFFIVVVLLTLTNRNWNVYEKKYFWHNVKHMEWYFNHIQFWYHIKNWICIMQICIHCDIVILWSYLTLNFVQHTINSIQ